MPHPYCSNRIASPIPFSYELLHVTIQTRLYHDLIIETHCFSSAIGLHPTPLRDSRCTTWINQIAQDCLSKTSPELTVFFDRDHSLKPLDLTGDEFNQLSITFHQLTFSECKGASEGHIETNRFQGVDGLNTHVQCFLQFTQRDNNFLTINNMLT